MESERVPNVELLQAYETATREEKSLLSTFRKDGVAGLMAAMGPEQFLDFVDFLVFKLGELGYGGEESLESLELLLADAGSSWKVGSRAGHASLEQRVPTGIAQAVDEVTNAPGDAGRLLAEAWNATFGRGHDYEKAYSKAVKAVEAAAIPVVSPANVRATLGTVIAQMKQQADWELGLTREHADYPTQEVVLGMLQALWTGQNDRHAGQPGFAASSAADAEAATLLAVPLVQWFTSGALKRKPHPKA
ncbi:hypothetical protein [Herbiconiux solani]|uniref:hypothetical protein n=1 Tax=Herbiconiux solani TaxID=661329 RepID=UPI000826F03A|nr:hypothetical protein [Herbiconiux solani]